MPTKRKRSAPRSAAPVEKPLAISPAARLEQHAVRVTVRLLSALQELDSLDRFRLAAVMMWMRFEWGGKADVLANTNAALHAIAVITDRERREALDQAADSTLRAAVTA